MPTRITQALLNHPPLPASASERIEILDTVVKGLALRVSVKRTLTWNFYYRMPGVRRRRRLKIGRYPEKSLADARNLARSWAIVVSRGEDPKIDEDRVKHSPTFSDVLDEYEALEACKKSSGKEMMRILRKDALPIWRDRKIVDITRRDAVLLLDKVRARAPVLCNRLAGRLVRLFNFAADRGLVPTNPLQGLQREPEAPRQRDLSDTEIVDLWHGLDVVAYRTPRPGMSPVIALALKMILVTGQRPGEVVGITRKEISPGLWSIPVERLKSGQRTKSPRPHEVPLSGLAEQLLQSATDLAEKRGLTDNGFVFASPSSEHRSRPIERRSVSRALQRNATELGNNPEGPYTPHDLRRTVRTRLAALGVDDIVAERVMGHELQGMARVYNQHRYLDEKRAALERWADELRRIVCPGAVSTEIPATTDLP